jgi:uracil-DNA glycosylase
VEVVPGDSVSGDGTADAARLAKLYAAKSRAELKAADSLLGAKVTIPGHGDPTAEVVIVKGSPDAGEKTSRKALSGDDGRAAEKALAALGFDPERTWATLSRPTGGDGDVCARRLEAIVEAVDPLLVIALDDAAAADLASAYRLTALVPGRPVVARGRIVGSVGGLAASLPDTAEKARVWERFKTIAAAVPGVREVPGARVGPVVRTASAKKKGA